jgi:Dolichyl-phosphate-mannose-protein mannosyltransferase
MQPAAGKDRALLVLCGAAVALHLGFAGRYGFFRDELYFIACGARPAWGYADQPPLQPLLAHGWDALVGGSLFAFRALPALCSGGLAWLAAQLARALGGSASAGLLAALSVTIAPVLMVSTHLFTVNTFEPLLWTLLALLLVRLLERPRLTRWLGLGAVIGVGLMNKYSMAFWALALLVGVALSARRGRLASRGLGAAFLVACLVPLPSILWQAARGWPFLELLRAGAAGKNAPFEAAGFLVEVILQMHPFTLPLWLAGLARLWRTERALAIGFGVFFATLFVLHAKPYYVAPAFPTLIAAGAAAADGLLVSAWRRAVALGLLLAGGALTAPLAVPILPVAVLIRYQRALGVTPTPLENKEYGELPQHLADQFGWPEVGLAARDAWQRLTPEERERAAVFSFNYGDASAIARFGGVPSISGHNQYGEWGPGSADGSVLLVYGGRREWIEPYYASIEQVGTGPSSAYMMPYERHQPIWLVRGPRQPLGELWPRLRHID